MTATDTPEPSVGQVPPPPSAPARQPATAAVRQVRGGGRTLSDARAAIPAECLRGSTALGLGYVARDLAVYASAIGALVWSRQPLLDAALIVLAGVAVSALFVQAHDAAHGSLLPSAKLNTAVARILMLPSLHLHEAWVLGHNRLHHGHTARQGMDFVWHPVTPGQYQALARLARLRHRLEWSWAGAGAYYLREVWWNKMITFSPPAKRAQPWRRDRQLVATWAGVASVAAMAVGWWRSGSPLGGLWLWAETLVLPFLVFSQVIGWAVYVHHVAPDISWSPRQQWSPWRGQMESTTVLRLPRPLNWLFHNIFLHVPHHVEPRIPWYRLPQAVTALEAAFPETVVDRRFHLRDYLRVVRACKLYDFESLRWTTYRRARPATPPEAA